MATIGVLFVGFFVTSQLNAQPITNVSISRVESAVAKGAVCLDGTPPAYYFDEGEGGGIDNWLIYLEGGSWCVNQTNCKGRAGTSLGSSHHRNDNMSFNGILSKNSTENPEFHNWNRAYVVYCDGSSFTGDIDAVDTVYNLTYRGARIFIAIMEELLAKGMNSAQNAILSGSLAGGLAAMIHCDYYREHLPFTAKVKCLPIASYFLHQENLIGSKGFEALVTLHGSAKTLPPLCTLSMRPSLCFFPQNLLFYVKTPIFIAMSAFDRIQISYNLFPEDVICLLNNNCTDDQNEAIQELRRDFLVELPKSIPLHRGIWITTCITHDLPYSWAMVENMKSLGYKTFPEAFDDWYFNRSYTPIIDTSEDAKNCSSIGIYP